MQKFKGKPSYRKKNSKAFQKARGNKVIKKCNDFGAGGVSVAVGELADGLYIDLDKVPLKYPGLGSWEIALSESQERMAVMISKEHLKEFMKYLEEEDLEAISNCRSY